MAEQPPTADRVKVCLTVGQALRLLCIDGWRNLFSDQSIRRMRMRNGILTVRVAQALLAVVATVASVLVVQFAMLMA